MSSVKGHERNTAPSGITICLTWWRRRATSRRRRRSGRRSSTDGAPSTSSTGSPSSTSSKTLNHGDANECLRNLLLSSLLYSSDLKTNLPAAYPSFFSYLWPFVFSSLNVCLSLQSSIGYFSFSFIPLSVSKRRFDIFIAQLSKKIV